ncbi:hypothetical protein DFP72DRAFT_817192 [Ephemerocybe angulata]|uniref:Uncharacterized protein n=1 Tax=Ephemerocybe angulata TaxID=980116 RepID=A0A8H6HQI7_9AGAR|nr:hypothetical protein DFP72DRAFT_817192 [Tulosesus angulatus]
MYTETRLPLHDVMHIPCMHMFGTTSTFYIVPVTEELSNTVTPSSYAHQRGYKADSPWW